MFTGTYGCYVYLWSEVLVGHDTQPVDKRRLLVIRKMPFFLGHSYNIMFNRIYTTVLKNYS